MHIVHSSYIPRCRIWVLFFFFGKVHSRVFDHYIYPSCSAFIASVYIQSFIHVCIELIPYIIGKNSTFENIAYEMDKRKMDIEMGWELHIKR